MINNQEEATLKGVVGKLAREVEELKEKVDIVVSAQGKVEDSLKDFAEARRSGPPVHFMKAEVVEKTIESKLNSQLVGSTVEVKVKNPVASIGKQSIERIDGLISAAERLVESNKTIRPRKPLLKVTIKEGKTLMWVGLAIAGLFLIGMIVSITWACKKVNSIQDKAFYWGDRAYHAATMNDDPNPGEAYHIAVSHFDENPDRVKEYVAGMETSGRRYQEVKQYLLSIFRERDTRDIRVLSWEIESGEGWFLYRFYDEETERSVHVWPDGKVEETTDKVVTDLASAQKYSKREIWTMIREVSAQ